MLSGDLLEFGGVQTGDGFGLLIDHYDGAGVEGAFNGGNAFGEKTFVFPQGGHCAGIDINRSFRSAVEYPSFSIGEFVGFGQK